jgi:hypothetical protein
MLHHSLPARSLGGRPASLRTLPEGAGCRIPKGLISRALLASKAALSSVRWIFLPALRETAGGRGLRAGEAHPSLRLYPLKVARLRADGVLLLPEGL